MIAEILYKN